jgi:hypothetical protein
LRQPALDLVLCCDVIYTTGAAAARPGLAVLIDRMRQGGRFLLHVPAYQWLYSDHDAAVHTRERFTARQVRQLLTGLGLKIELLTYRVCLLFPLVVLRRLPSILRNRMGETSRPESDLTVPATWINRLLRGVMRIENRLIEWGVRFPFGSSIIAVARKPDTSITAPTISST